jgi:16S rRNA (adenine1518-N6/adenine1519-N6)-dimethyltransferase
MQTRTQIRDLLALHGLSPRRSLGQNFLVDQNLLSILIRASGARAGDLVLEVGPGTGTLTEELLAIGCEVIACELDRGLAELLRERFAAAPPGRLTLVEGDCLRSKKALAEPLLRAVDARPFILVANLPFAVATPLLVTLLVDHPHCARLAATVQREVGDRLRAMPGSREYGSLSILAQALGTVRLVAQVPRTCFWPEPDVDAAMVLIERRADPLTRDPRGLARFLARLFRSRRKQMGALLSRELPWPAGIDPSMRAETLSPEQIVRLGEALGEIASPFPPDPVH